MRKFIVGRSQCWQRNEHKIISTGKRAKEGEREEKVYISLSAAFDHYESRQIEILMESAQQTEQGSFYGLFMMMAYKEAERKTQSRCFKM